MKRNTIIGSVFEENFNLEIDIILNLFQSLLFNIKREINSALENICPRETGITALPETSVSLTIWNIIKHKDWSCSYPKGKNFPKGKIQRETRKWIGQESKPWNNRWLCEERRAPKKFWGRSDASTLLFSWYQSQHRCSYQSIKTLNSFYNMWEFVCF